MGAQRVGQAVDHDSLALAEALCARMCHDFGGPVGSLAAVMDLGADGGPDAAELARDSVETLRRRIRIFRLLAGADEALPAPALRDCLDGMLAHGKVGLDAGGLAPGSAVPADAVPAVLAAILLGAEALPRGGTVALAGDPAASLMVIPQGRNAAWPPALVALLGRGGAEAELSPRTVLAHWLQAAARRAGLAARLVLGPTGAALMIARAG